jgi:PAS domain S-box-containing protein
MPRPRLQPFAAQLLLGITGLALITFVCFQAEFGLARTGFVYVMLLALVSLLGSFTASIVLSLLAAGCLNYLFAPRLFDLRVDLPEDIERIVLFLTTALIVTALTTRRKRAQEQLAEGHTRSEEAQRLAHIGWWERDLSTDRVTVSDEVVRILGARPVGRWLNLIHPEDRTWAAEAAAAAIRPGGPRYDVEYRVVRPDGTLRVVHSKGDVSRDSSGRALRQFGVLQDVTDLRQAEQELRDSEERFRTLVQFSFDVYWESDAQHRFTRQEFSERLSDAPASGSEIGKTRWEVPYLEPDEEAWRKHRETLDAHLPFRDFELARPTPDGGKRYVSVSGLPAFDKAGRFLGYRGVGRHITERKRAEDALRRSEAYLAATQRQSHTGTWVFDGSGTLYWSEECFRIWGLDPKQGLPGREAIRERIHPDDRDRVAQAIKQSMRQRHPYAADFRIVLPDGTIKYIESRSIGPPSFSGGKIAEVLGIDVDVTERKRAEQEHERLRELESDLAHMNRLSIMGELTASLAHEILHPIATARNNARAGMRFLEKTTPNLEEVREALACIVRDADRAKDIVDRLRDHIKKAPRRTEAFDLNAAITEVLDMVGSVTDRNRLSVHTQLANGMRLVQGDRVQLQQVVLNLVLNAVEAMSSVEGARELCISTRQGETGNILVAVCDSGTGLDPEKIEQVFAPFYTTKSGGIGMGLSICRSIIAAHGGRLWAECNEPQGAIFQFTLPPTFDGS